MSDPIEQTASAHESLSALLHAIDPRVLIRIACAAAKLDSSALFRVRYRNPRTEVPASSRRALGIIVDLVYTVHSANGRVVGFWIFEVELSFTLDKIRRWALYEIGLEAEYRANGRLAVFSPEPKLRRKIRTRLLPRIPERSGGLKSNCPQGARAAGPTRGGGVRIEDQADRGRAGSDRADHRLQESTPTPGADDPRLPLPCAPTGHLRGASRRVSSGVGGVAVGGRARRTAIPC